MKKVDVLSKKKKDFYNQNIYNTLVIIYIENTFQINLKKLLKDNFVILEEL